VIFLTEHFSIFFFLSFFAHLKGVEVGSYIGVYIANTITESDILLQAAAEEGH
jgi:hypothetical protein